VQIPSKWISTLTEITGKPELITQRMIDELYTQIVADCGIVGHMGKQTKRAKGHKNQAGHTWKRKRYRYASESRTLS